MGKDLNNKDDNYQFKVEEMLKKMEVSNNEKFDKMSQEEIQLLIEHNSNLKPVPYNSLNNEECTELMIDDLIQDIMRDRAIEYMKNRFPRD